MIPTAPEVMDRIQTLEEAKSLSISGLYREALALIEPLLVQNPRDVDALRLKGNILELQVLETEAEMQGKKHVTSVAFRKARACYEQILLIEPNHLGAMTDLGSHWHSLGEDSKALRYFDRVIAFPHACTLHRDEFIEAVEGKIEILREQGDAKTVASLEETLRGIKQSTNLGQTTNRI